MIRLSPLFSPLCKNISAIIWSPLVDRPAMESSHFADKSSSLSRSHFVIVFLAERARLSCICTICVLSIHYLCIMDSFAHSAGEWRRKEGCLCIYIRLCECRLVCSFLLKNYFTVYRSNFLPLLPVRYEIRRT
ncbi:hypothetical protein BDN70DRAFT_297733 [Pholiota conissans]|uniref:Uncharacterized protein n=1 Tax=Pholiota conissans TaxID=109636 RepID=A0A9P6CQ57_9AGAR|nr:hypothetical protein BDN70DRAFT_297733 [Pholiota conissans]